MTAALAKLALCPNEPRCPHVAAFHDIYEPGDPYPTCCAEGCRCGKPGTATCARNDDGTVVVLDADPVILVAQELLDNAEPWAWDAEREVLQLDTAGEFRYRYLRRDEATGHHVFGRERT